MRFGTKWLDLEAQALRDDEGNEHPLTASEFGLLKVFAANPKRVLSRERLLELANARDAEAFDRAVDLRIMRIRRKIEIDPTKPAVIRTIRGGGYLFSPTGEKEPRFGRHRGGSWEACIAGSLREPIYPALKSSHFPHIEITGISPRMFRRRPRDETILAPHETIFRFWCRHPETEPN